MLRKIFFAINLCLIGLTSSSIYADVFSDREEVKQFIQELNFTPKDKKHALRALSKIESSPEIIQRITTPYEALSWDKYQALLVTEKRIQGGIKFWRDNEAMLQQAEQMFGVPASVIVAIIGIESSYGENRGKYLVLQALATLAFDYQPRAAFFKNELKEYLLLVQEQGLDPLELKGSYAGAMGSPQFISSSYRNFAIDFDKSGKIDLINNMNQCIGSVANYFKVHGWKTGKPVAYQAKLRGTKFKTLPIAAAKNPIPVLSLDTLKKHGVSARGKISESDTTVALLEFDNGSKKEYWLGFNNFYVITRYNHSSNYALAVYKLSEAINKLKQK